MKHLSFEFFPPQTPAGVEKLTSAAQALADLHPEYYSVTFGAGGSTQERTKDVVYRLQEAVKVAITPHISCIGTDKNVISSLLDGYKQHHISHLVTLRGDMPSGMVARGEFHFATELVNWIRKTYGDEFYISVACYPETHPQSLNAFDDFQHFIEKAKAGANDAITQYFYNVDAYFYFVEKCRKTNINIPIIPGIMPITNYYRLARFSEMCGAEMPRWIRKQLESYGDDVESIKAFGIEVVTKLCEKLLQGGVPGLHFYTLNDATASISICKNLGIN